MFESALSPFSKGIMAKFRMKSRTTICMHLLVKRKREGRGKGGGGERERGGGGEEAKRYDTKIFRETSYRGLKGLGIVPESVCGCGFIAQAVTGSPAYCDSIKTECRRGRKFSREGPE